MTPEEIAKMVSEDVNAPMDDLINEAKEGAYDIDTEEGRKMYGELSRLFNGIHIYSSRAKERFNRGPIDDKLLENLLNLKASVARLEEIAKALVPKRGGPPQPKSPAAQPERSGRYSQMGPGEGFK